MLQTLLQRIAGFTSKLIIFRVARNPPAIDVLENDETVPNGGGLTHHEL